MVAAAGMIAAGDTITFGNQVDVITDFVSGTDKIDIALAVPGALTNLVGQDEANLTDNALFATQGTYNVATGQFVIAAGGPDTIVMQGGAAASANDVVATNTSVVILVGTGAVAIGDFM